MEWLDTTESGNAPGSHLSQAFTLIPEVPSTFTARTHKTAVKAKQQRDEAQEGAQPCLWEWHIWPESLDGAALSRAGLLLRAFSGTSASCSKDQQASRLSAARANWAHLEQQHQVNTGCIAQQSPPASSCTHIHGKSGQCSGG